MDIFKSKFKFDPGKRGMLGVEVECHLTNGNGSVAPIAQKVLERLSDESFGYELSACQLEYRVGPCVPDDLGAALQGKEALLQSVEKELRFGRLYDEVGPEDIPLDVYPDPTGRYQEIVKGLPKNVLKAACQVIGTHIHVGMGSPEEALKVYNKVTARCKDLCRIGDGSSGRRLEIYQEMEPDFEPSPYSSWDDFHFYAQKKGFEDDPRKCWTLIRISVHGTIEFRMFGATNDTEKIVSWATLCRSLCFA